MVILEIILIIYIYGLPNFLDDLRSMFGYPRTWLGRIFGPTGYYIQGIWCFLAPLQITILFIVVLFTQISHNLTYGKDKRLYEYPGWAIGLGWLISIIPILLLPIMAVYNLLKFRQKRKVQGLDTCGPTFVVQRGVIEPKIQNKMKVILLHVLQIIVPMLHFFPKNGGKLRSLGNHFYKRFFVSKQLCHKICLVRWWVGG
ncbi:unnamed protein product [Meloidogyne enterolobii]|uniref:Uncharacterized protein n=2 Tax=Meloidogyne enterolobii TaxID=390850 RepID=A0ACB1AQQ7_MELEN|nr:unnamed protein product [Meloidogyne enterolobii]